MSVYTIHSFFILIITHCPLLGNPLCEHFHRHYANDTINSNPVFAIDKPYQRNLFTTDLVGIKVPLTRDIDNNLS